MSAEQLITVRLAQWRDYQFDVDFGAAVPTLRADEPPPLGRGEGPSPSSCSPPRSATAWPIRCCSHCASTSSIRSRSAAT